MTTINNDQSLIEKVGGIDRAIALEAMLQKHAVPESWKISIINGMWYRSSVGFTHSDLRTAIAKHDSPEFKVGDKIVMIKSYAYDDVREIKEFCDSGKVCITTDGRKLRLSLSSGYMVHRHASPSEIKAGHRIDDTTDHVADIRNHVSPSTRVVDL